MKKIFWMLFAALMTVFTACDNSEELVFEHEYPMFELREGAILLEVLMPAGTAQEDELYIVGEFNGGEEQAVGQLMWQLEPSQNTHKWGIYLYPETFVNGKSLADGYYFYSKQDGKERTVKNEDILHYETAAPGNRVNNIMVSRWESYFLSEGPEIEHDGFVVYVLNETSWGSDLAMYAWGDAEAFGGWPGKQPDGQELVGDVIYTYFDLGAANTGLNLNLIFNNNGGGSQLADYNVTISENIFLRLTDEGVETLAGEPLPETDGYALFVDNQAGWEALALYVWGGTLGNDAIGGWPGMQPSGTWKKKGVTYTYFDLGAANNGLDGNFIVNDNGVGSQTNGDIAWTLDKHLFIRIFADKSWVEVDPENPDATETPETPEQPEEPVVPEIPTGSFKIYVKNLTEDALSLYCWGDGAAQDGFGGWPGMAASGSEEIDGVTFDVFNIPEALNGLTLNPIFNANQADEATKWQIDAPQIVVNRDYYFEVSKEAVTELEMAPSYKIYVKNLTEDALSLYCWGDGAAQDGFGGWPGMAASGSEEINGVTFLVFEIPTALNGLTLNPIFNANQADEATKWQIDAPQIIVDRDYYFEVSKEAVTEINL